MSDLIIFVKTFCERDSRKNLTKYTFGKIQLYHNQQMHANNMRIKCKKLIGRCM